MTNGWLVSMVQLNMVSVGYNVSYNKCSSPSRTHHARVIVVSIGLAAPTVTRVPVSIATIAGVKGAGDGVFISLHHIVLGAPDVVTKVGIAVVVSVSGVVARHVDEVGCSVAVTGDVAQVKCVGKMFVIERYLR